MDYVTLSKKQSGIIFLLVYAFAMIVGLLIVLLGRNSIEPVLLMFIADVAMTIIIYLIGIKLKNASLYDPYWSVIPVFIIAVWMIAYHHALNITTILLILVIVIWASRLTYNWWKNWVGFKNQDWRYDLLREKNKKLYPMTNLFGIHLIPTFVVFLQMINVYAIVQEDSINAIFIVGAFFSLVAPIIQFIADKQMYDFRNDKQKTVKVINTGLWRFTRHPNYFGELLFWVGIYVMYFSFKMSLDLYILFPISMILLFVFISVPMMEKKLIVRPGYKDYIKHVSMIIPFFPKKKL